MGESHLAALRSMLRWGPSQKRRNAPLSSIRASPMTTSRTDVIKYDLLHRADRLESISQRAIQALRSAALSTGQEQSRDWDPET